MGKFNRDGDRGFGGNRGGGFKRGGFGDRDREVVMHDVICSECQKNCQVPFRPSNDKPVYCKDCFAKRGGPSKSSFGNRNDSRPQMRPSFENNTGNNDTKKQLEMINIKLDKLIKAIESTSKPVQSETKEAVKEISAVKTKKVAKKKAKK